MRDGDARARERERDDIHYYEIQIYAIVRPLP